SRPTYLTLVSVYLQFEDRFDVTSDVVHYTLCGFLTPRVDTTIIGVAYETMSSRAEFCVQFVQDNIRQKWTQRATLWCTFCSLLFEPIFHNATTKIFSDEF